ncbi:hypothetical protein B4135_1382 [Caldibacillus debilis]|uniref:Uncharacterized protein n=1 Tax=Caldibacillus debilis TaxID=301148 RepID=A0A150MD78_9BACI|nr:hypothetical protein B4135_1382 [Caldibacillus debilis]
MIIRRGKGGRPAFRNFPADVPRSSLLKCRILTRQSAYRRKRDRTADILHRILTR